VPGKTVRLAWGNLQFAHHPEPEAGCWSRNPNPLFPHEPEEKLMVQRSPAVLLKTQLCRCPKLSDSLTEVEEAPRQDRRRSGPGDSGCSLWFDSHPGTALRSAGRSGRQQCPLHGRGLPEAGRGVPGTDHPRQGGVQGASRDRARGRQRRPAVTTHLSAYPAGLVGHDRAREAQIGNRPGENATPMKFRVSCPWPSTERGRRRVEWKT
jgi:hypothetical protein